MQKLINFLFKESPAPIVAIFFLVLILAIGGCISTSSSTGSSAETKASAGASGASNVGTSDTNRLKATSTKVKIPICFIGTDGLISAMPNGKNVPIYAEIETPNIDLESGSKVSNTNEQNAIAEASAKASGEAVAKGTANITTFMLILLGIMGLLFALKMWDRFSPYSKISKFFANGGSK